MNTCENTHQGGRSRFFRSTLLSKHSSVKCSSHKKTCLGRLVRLIFFCPCICDSFISRHTEQCQWAIICVVITAHSSAPSHHDVSYLLTIQLVHITKWIKYVWSRLWNIYAVLIKSGGYLFCILIIYCSLLIIPFYTQIQKFRSALLSRWRRRFRAMIFFIFLTFAIKFKRVAITARKGINKNEFKLCFESQVI